MPTLQLLNGPKAGTQWPILGDRFVIGRDPMCDAEVNNTSDQSQSASVSRRHASIVKVDCRWYIEDGDGEGRKSRNGTHVNEKKLPCPGRRELRDQDRIRICDLKFVFHIDFGSDLAIEASVGHSDSGSCLDAQPAERLRQLLDVSAALRGTLDADAIIDRTLDHLFHMFPQAQRAMVVFREGPNGQLSTKALRTPRGNPADSQYSSTIIFQCLETLEAILGNDLPKQFPESDSIETMTSRSLMCTPLWMPGGQAVGAIQLDTKADDRKFTLDDLRLFLGVANQVSISLSNARLHRETLELQRRARDLEVAQQVQRALLPHGLPAVSGYAFFAHYESAQEVGGDYYDFIPLGDGRLAVLLGDVAGKGVSAALVVAKFSVEARVCLETHPHDPAAALDKLNALMIRAAVPEKFVTLTLAVLDPQAHTLLVANAGHPSPLLLTAGGQVEVVAEDDVSGLPIGIEEGTPYKSCEVRLNAGDRLVLFSDGVYDALNVREEGFGMERLRASVGRGGPPAAVCETLIQSVRTHIGSASKTDDITVVCFGREVQ